MNSRHKFPYAFGLCLALLGVAMLFPFSGGAAQNPQSGSQASSPGPRELPNFDAFWSTPNNSSPALQKNAQSPRQPQMQGGHPVQYEPRLAVPTFLWAADGGPARSVSTAALAQSGSGKQSTGPEAAARDHLRNYESTYRLSDDDVANARLAMIHDTGRGPIVVKFKQEIGGVEVFRDEVSMIMNRDLQLVAIAGYLTGDDLQ